MGQVTKNEEQDKQNAGKQGVSQGSQNASNENQGKMGQNPQRESYSGSQGKPADQNAPSDREKQTGT